MSKLADILAKRRTFAIISHPDAGKTTLTEKLLLLGKAIQLAGTVKGKKSGRYATSDWMELEKQRGISVTTSVMQFPFKSHIINLLDTPGHADFSEDTYRTLTAVDSAVMVIDAAKGVEARTIKLLEVCRLRQTPIMTFINKLDREGRDPLELLDEIEDILKIQCAPVTWPIGMGKNFKGVYHLVKDTIHLYTNEKNQRREKIELIQGLHSEKTKKLLGHEAEELIESIELVKGASHTFDLEAYRKGELTPVFFGTALGNFGIEEMMEHFVEAAPAPLARDATIREVAPDEPGFSGFVFKIQANMDPAHHDRMAFMRICSGQYQKGMKVRHVRLGREMALNNVHTFLAGDRTHAEEAFPGDIIGIHNHGTIQIGDTFTASKNEQLKFTGIPYFAPELFRRVQLKDPLKMKALQKGLQQLSEEGATQIFKPLIGNDLVLGAVGVLQFDVVAHRLQYEYKVECRYDPVNVATARWIVCNDTKTLENFKRKAESHLAIDGSGALTYLAPSMVNLHLTQERHPDVQFFETREHQ